jgi:hypothetical protein
MVTEHQAAAVLALGRDKTSRLADEDRVSWLLAEMPELTAPGILERLWPMGYTGDITILRGRVSKLRPRPQGRRSYAIAR